MTRLPDLPLRRALAERIRSLKSTVAATVTAEFFLRHPDWLDRYGEPGRARGLEDACFHLDFLAGAIESGSTTQFEDYARWTSRMLESRNIDPVFVAENLEQLDQALAARLSGPEHAQVANFLSAGRAACESRASSSSPAPTALALSQSLFRQAILKGHRQTAVTIVAEARREGHSVLDIYADVLQESLYQVGGLWETNQITVAEEHLATAMTLYVLARTFDQLPRSDRSRGNMVVTGVSGELHQVGANMVADALESQGYSVRFLGTNVPHSAILEQLEEHRADVLGISATLLSSVPQVIRLVESVRARPKSPRIVLGGAAFRLASTLGEELGVEVAGDVRGAVRLLCD